LFNHQTRPITFSLVVDDFGVKYVGREHAEHLVATLEKLYTSRRIGQALNTVASHSTGILRRTHSRRGIHAGLSSESTPTFPTPVPDPTPAFAVCLEQTQLWRSYPTYITD
jgi:hypothetical protein